MHFSVVGNNISGNGGLSIYLRKAGPPYNPVTDQQIVNITNTRAEQEVFLTTNKDESDVVVAFAVNAPENSMFWLDNISLAKVDSTLSTAASDESVLFVYNKTNMVKNIPLNGVYKNTDGTILIKTVSLKPNTSAILVKQNVPIVSSTEK